MSDSAALAIKIARSGIAERIPRREFDINHLEPGWVILGTTDDYVYIGLEPFTDTPADAEKE